MFKTVHLFLVFSLSFYTFSQQLMINEVSQGTGTAEYVEFVVIGSPVCEGEPIPCIDLRKVIVDDNNGFFAQGTGTGIAGGALRFSNSNFWSCVPQGTYIVIYNETNPNSSLPADDISLSDGNCSLVIPGNSSLLESTSVSPTASPFDPTYPTSDSDWGPSAGWNVVAMANSDDSFQIPNLGINGTPLHSVSWGNNTGGAIILFAGAAGGKVMSFKNLVNNDFNDQQNWVMEDVAAGQTPGAANSTANDLWIGTMNPTCRVNPALNFTVTNTDCGADNGAITLILPAGINADILWETGAATATINNLAAGTYTVVVTENLTGCTFTDSAEVTLNNSTLAVGVNATSESCTNQCDGDVQLAISGGQAPYTTTWMQNGNVIPEPASFCAGTYDFRVTDANGCEVNETVVISTETELVYTISPDAAICAGDSVELAVTGVASVVWSTGAAANEITVSPAQTTSFTATITEAACTVTETVTVGVSNCDLAVSFPNIFTPNNDNDNDVYVPQAFTGVTNEDFTILNRWGNIVYQSKDQVLQWDGKVGGKDAAEGVYFYVCTYREANAAESKTVQGFLQLKRK
ncbi:MAG: gliding motility-associated C-terminal domain-containing protein [Bacteroidota bacterium]